MTRREFIGKSLAVGAGLLLLAGKKPAPMDVQDTSSGRTYYLAPWGDDANDGTNARPWRTFTRGLDTIRAEDTLIFRRGTYGN